jgi:hypothetical protein
VKIGWRGNPEPLSRRIPVVVHGRSGHRLSPFDDNGARNQICEYYV